METLQQEEQPQGHIEGQVEGQIEGQASQEQAPAQEKIKWGRFFLDIIETLIRQEYEWMASACVPLWMTANLFWSAS